MITPGKYACNGGEVTVAEAARALHVSSETVRIRLKKYGGNMQRVWDYYAGKEEKAAKEILAALGMEETGVEEAGTQEEDSELRESECSETPEPEAAAPETGMQEPDKPETVVIEDVEPEDAEPDRSAEETPLAALRRLNRAIEALSGLYEGDVGGLSKDIVRIRHALRMIRATRYEKFVDWDMTVEDMKK
jgi:hypothetical protein